MRERRGGAVGEGGKGVHSCVSQAQYYPYRRSIIERERARERIKEGGGV